VVLAGKQFALAAFDEGKLQPVWARPFDPSVGAGPPVAAVAPGAGGGVVAGVDSGNVLRAFDSGTGKPLWSLQLRVTPGSPPVIWDGRVYIEEPGLTEDLAQHDHRVTVLDARTGAFEASWELPGVLIFGGSGIRSGDRLLVDLSQGVAAIRPEQR